MYFCTALLIRKAPRRCTPRTVSQSSSVILNSRLSRITPALLTSTVGSPSSAATPSTAALTWSLLLTSAPTPPARPARGQPARRGGTNAAGRAGHDRDSLCHLGSSRLFP